MKFTVLAAALVAATALLPATASAAILNYSLYGGSGPADSAFYRFNFQLDTSRVPSFSTNTVLRYAPTPVTYFLPGSTTPILGTNSNLGPSFFTALDQGGISILRLEQGSDPQPRFFGVPLFSGTTASPTFLTGSFALSTMPKNVPSDVQIFNYRIDITDAAAAVPEPATWALLLTGFGMIGIAARRRSRTIAA